MTATPPDEAPRRQATATALFSGVTPPKPSASPKPAPAAQKIPPPPAGPPAPCHSLLALDIDGTITTADQHVVAELVRAARAAGAHVVINTARPQLYCNEPEPELTSHLVARADHYCGSNPWCPTGTLAGAVVWSILADVPKSKLENMDAAASRCSVRRRDCALLVDDRPENIRAVERAGYTGILVDERTGITSRIAHDILSRVKACAEN